MLLYSLTYLLKEQAVCKSKYSLRICHSASIQENNMNLIFFSLSFLLSFLPSYLLSFILSFFLPSLLSLFLLSIHPRNIYFVCKCQYLAFEYNFLLFLHFPLQLTTLSREIQEQIKNHAEVLYLSTHSNCPLEQKKEEHYL